MKQPEPSTDRGSSSLQRQEKTTVSSQTTHGAADMTRRMVCGGLAGMIAKVRFVNLNLDAFQPLKNTDLTIDHHSSLSINQSLSHITDRPPQIH